MENFESELPRHNVIDSQFDCTGSTLIVMCYGRKFHIRVEAQDLQGTTFLAKYQQLLESLQDDEEDVDAYETICDWILHPCLPILRHVEAQTPQQFELTLQDFYFPPTFQLRLLISNDGIIARHTPRTSPDREWSLALENDRLPPFPNVSRFTASKITIVSDENGDYGCEIPRKVYSDAGKEYFFKPALDKSQYIREVQCHTRIAHAGLHDDLKVSKLAGVVTSDDQKMTIGLLLEWIPSFGDLQGIKAKRQKKFHAQWKHQITATVKELHKHRIIWGDVHPGNIIIDLQMNAWVIDFGGGWVEPFVTRKMCGTVEGDLCGIANVFKHLETWEIGEMQSMSVNSNSSSFGNEMCRLASRTHSVSNEDNGLFHISNKVSDGSQSSSTIV